MTTTTIKPCKDDIAVTESLFWVVDPDMSLDHWNGIAIIRGDSYYIKKISGRKEEPAFEIFKCEEKKNYTLQYDRYGFVRSCTCKGFVNRMTCRHATDVIKLVEAAQKAYDESF